MTTTSVIHLYYYRDATRIILELSNTVVKAQHSYGYIYCRVATAEKILVIQIPPSTIKRYTLSSIKVQHNGNRYVLRYGKGKYLMYIYSVRCDIYN